ncbi:MAG: fibronectin type III domain-containing protein [Bacteroidia bacterium]
MNKRKVSLAFLKDPIPQKIQKGRYIVSQMTGNVTYPTPNPDLLTVTGIINTLETKYEAASDGGKSKKLQQQTAEDNFDNIFRELAIYAEDESKGDGEKITSAGFELEKVREAATRLGAIQGLKSEPGKNEGEIDLKFKPLKGAKTKIVQMKEEVAQGGTQPGNPGPGSPSGTAAATGIWVTLDEPVTKSRHTVKNLKSGTKYSFRVAGVNSKGRGDWSDITICVAR